MELNNFTRLLAVLLSGLALGLIVYWVIQVLGVQGNEVVGQTSYLHSIQKNTNKPEFSFVALNCGEKKYPQDSGVLSFDWVGDVLEVKAFTSIPYCSGATLVGSYVVKENDLFLNYAIISGLKTRCVCQYELSYKIKGLSKKNYNVVLT